MTIRTRGIIWSPVVQEAGYQHGSGSPAAKQVQLQVLETEFCPIMITDRNMPGMDGVTLCKRAREGHYPGYLYIFLLTAQNGQRRYRVGPEGRRGRLSRARRIFSALGAGRASGQCPPHRQSRTGAAPRARSEAPDGEHGRTHRRLQPALPGAAAVALELERTRRFNHPVSVLLLDIDYFKRINDRYGHATGDEVLRSTYRRLRDLLPRACDWIGRCGGGEFLIVLIDTDLRGAEIVAERLVHWHGGNCRSKLRSGPVPVTISIGGAEAAQMLIERAELQDACWRSPIDACTRASAMDATVARCICRGESPIAAQLDCIERPRSVRTDDEQRQPSPRFCTSMTSPTFARSCRWRSGSSRRCR